MLAYLNKQAQIEGSKANKQEGAKGLAKKVGCAQIEG
jgi:hypothetical protein